MIKFTDIANQAYDDIYDRVAEEVDDIETRDTIVYLIIRKMYINTKAEHEKNYGTI